jgi:hypothetical protein
MNNQTPREKVVLKFQLLSDKYHKLSLLFYEMSKSLNVELKPMENSPKRIKEYLKNKLNLDLEKIKNLSQDIKNISFDDLKGGNK